MVVTQKLFIKTANIRRPLFPGDRWDKRVSVAEIMTTPPPARPSGRRQPVAQGHACIQDVAAEGLAGGIYCA